MTTKIPPFKLASAVEPGSRRPAEVQMGRRGLGGSRDRHASQVGRGTRLLAGPRDPALPGLQTADDLYGQLDSINDDFCLADCGIIQVFVCFDCYKTTSFIHSY